MLHFTLSLREDIRHESRDSWPECVIADETAVALSRFKKGQRRSGCLQRLSESIG
jgi:hypothetical protein